LRFQWPLYAKPQSFVRPSYVTNALIDFETQTLSVSARLATDLTCPSDEPATPPRRLLVYCFSSFFSQLSQIAQSVFFSAFLGSTWGSSILAHAVVNANWSPPTGHDVHKNRSDRTPTGSNLISYNTSPHFSRNPAHSNFQSFFFAHTIAMQ
jgi:hypothetical protein